MYLPICEVKSTYGQTILSGPDAVVEYTRTQLKGIANADQEFFALIPMNVRNCAGEAMIIAAGGQSYAPVDPKILFRRLLLAEASSFVVSHNHPGATPEPSPEDRAMTEKLGQAGKLLELTLLDHIILTNTGYISFRENGLL